jgi:hypothetical protein
VVNNNSNGKGKGSPENQKKGKGSPQNGNANIAIGNRRNMRSALVPEKGDIHKDANDDSRGESGNNDSREERVAKRNANGKGSPGKGSQGKGSPQKGTPGKGSPGKGNQNGSSQQKSKQNTNTPPKGNGRLSPPKGNKFQNNNHINDPHNLNEDSEEEEGFTHNVKAKIGRGGTRSGRNLKRNHNVVEDSSDRDNMIVQDSSEGFRDMSREMSQKLGDDWLRSGH